MPKILVLNGPNLNLLGTREPHLYGSETLAQIEARCREAAAGHGFEIDFCQFNDEGRIIDRLHQARGDAAGVVINPAGFSFTSVAILDALKASELPVVEVHITNIHRREPMYHKSLMSSVAVGVICGLGPYGYLAALGFLAEHLKARGGAPGAP